MDAEALGELQPSVVVTSLARALVSVHDGAVPADLPTLLAADVVDRARSLDGAAWRVPHGSPYARLDPTRRFELLESGAADVERRAGPRTATIGSATLANLEVPDPAIDEDGVVVGLSAASNVRFLPARRLAPADPDRRPHFVDSAHGALADPYRDLAIASADVVATFGPAAILGFVDAYATARPTVEPIDPIRLEWWSLAATLPDPGPW